MKQKTNGLTITWLRALIEKRTKQINDVIDAGLYEPYKESIGSWFNDITEAEIAILKIRRARIFKKLK
jgi:hypothetical protein